MTRMRPLLQHASRALFASLVPIAPHRASNATLSRFATTTASSRSSICWRCQFRTSALFTTQGPGIQLSVDNRSGKRLRRQFSSSKDRTEPEKSSDSSEGISLPPPPQTAGDASISHPSPPVENPTPSPQPVEDSVSLPPVEDAAPPPTGEPEAPPKSAQVEDTIDRVPAEALPSHREGQRWDLSKRVSEIMDELLPKLAVVTQKVNTYTGTDYSSIAALKREIQEQEKLVKKRRLAIEEAKQALDTAHAQQGSSQKEVVALLERKHSWSATDLERYMALIRSEHINDQAIREAKDAVLAAENALEEARSQLEKRERAQYHEEQIWSDTIRRNSTWVTFGLMGLNIFLLLLSLVILEPWRRRRMVTEIKTALEEAQKPIIAATPTSVPHPTAAIEAEIDEVVEPAGQRLEDIVPEAAATMASSEREPTSPTPEPTESVQAETTEAYATDDSATELLASATPDSVESVAAIDIEAEVNQDMTRLEQITAKLKELQSEELVSVRKKDLTATVCVAAAAGWVFATVAFWVRSG